jgi:hypothetical protein
MAQCVRSALQWMSVALVAATHCTAQGASNLIKFETRHGFLMVVTASAGGLDRLSCLVDTGATKTMLDRRIAQKLRLKIEHRKTINLDRQTDVEWGKVNHFKLGDLEVRDFDVMIGDLGKFSEFAAGLDAVIGMDFLQLNDKIEFDYLTNAITFHPSSDSGTRQASTLTAMTLDLYSSGQRIHLLLDSGIHGLFLYEDRLRSHDIKLNFEETVDAQESRIHGRSANIPLRVGTKSEDAQVFLIEHAPPGLPPTIDGYIGMDALHANWIELDFVAPAIRWR